MEIEIGDYVTIIGGDMDGWTGILDNEFVADGKLMYTVIDENDYDVFHYASEIKLFKKAA